MILYRAERRIISAIECPKERRRQYERERREKNHVMVWAEQAIRNCKKRSIKNKLEFNLTKEWLMGKAVETCPLIGLKISYNNTKPQYDSPSVDRIDPTRGYTIDNCEVISQRANQIKSDARLEELERFIQNIRAYIQRTRND